jgi:hypothetical protein
VTLRPSLLFTAPSAGLCRCSLVALTGTEFAIMSVHAGTTWLSASAGDEVGSHWWQNPDCDSEGILSTCKYLGGSGEPQQLDIFYNDGTRATHGVPPIAAQLSP